MNIDKGKLSPMMKRYFQIKDNYPDCLLFFRLGDFYEMFFDDAVTASRVLDLTLTGRDCGLEERAPMCGVPYHAVDNYIRRLIENGYRVAICEQLSDPATSKGLVDRDVVRVVSSGTVMEEDILDEKNPTISARFFQTQTRSVSHGLTFPQANSTFTNTRARTISNACRTYSAALLRAKSFATKISFLSIRK